LIIESGTSGKAAIEIGSLVWYFCHVIFALSNEAVGLLNDEQYGIL